MRPRYAPPPLSVPRIYRSQIPTGYVGTKKTAGQIRNLIRAGARDFYVRQKAIDILLERRVKSKDYLGEIKALFEWVQGNIRYTKDPHRVEVLHSARRLLELRAGDCDDMAILLGAMLQAVGHPVRLALAGPDFLRPRLFTHVYLEVYYKGHWMPLDPTMPYPMGWEPRALVKKVISIERRPKVLAEETKLQGAPIGEAVPDWLRGLIKALRSDGLQPKDARVKSLWELLRQRQLLGRSAWLRRLLRHVWSRGALARPRPRTTRRVVRLLRRWGVVPPRAATPAPSRQQVTSISVPVRVRPVIPVTVRPVRPVTVRPVARRTLQPLTMQRVAQKASRR